MATYTVTGRDNEGSPLIAVSIGSIDQEPHVVDEQAIVDAVRDRVAQVAGVQSVVARKYEQVITII